MHHDTQFSTASSRQARPTTSLPALRTARPPRRAAAVLGKVVVAMIAVVVYLVGGVALTDAAEVRDISIEVPTIEIKGDVLKPEVLGEPWIPKIIVPTMPKLWQVEVTDSTLDAQRKLVIKAKDAATKRAQQIKLAAMLYMNVHESFWEVQKALEDPQRVQLTEASRVLGDVVQHAGDNLLDEGVRRLLAACQFLLQDYPASEKTWRTLLEENPNSKYRSYHRAWLAYALLKQSKNQEALAAVAAETIDDNQPELAYVAAWARWRSHDGAGALKAIEMAEKHWQQFPCNSLDGACLATARNNGDRDHLFREERLLAGRSDVPASQAVTELKLIWLQDLGIDGYGRSGRWADGIAMLDKQIEVHGDHVFSKDRVAIRSAQAEYAARLDEPETVAKYAAKTIDALAVCGEWCDDKYKADTLQRVHAIARLFYRIYIMSNDPRYYQPTCDLYAMTMPLLSNGATHAQAEKEVALLGTTFKNASESSGTHDKDVLGELLGLHDHEIKTCYEVSLTSSQALAGSITLEIDADVTGAMKGVTAQPVGSVAELSAVASCVAEHAKQWRLPRRGGAGSTHVKMSYTLTPGGSKD